MMGSIAEKWKILSGQDNWKSLLDPLDLDLRRYLIHYGEMAEATYDTFNTQRESKYAGSSRYARENLFTEVGLQNANPFKYRAVKYFYATSHLKLPACFLLPSLSRGPWCKESNWMGYLAVATDEGKVALGRRDILIAWRGTVQPLEWVEDFDFPLASASKLFGSDTKVGIHSGWLSIYTSDDPHSPFNKLSVRDQVLAEVSSLIQEYQGEEISISITGHSLGAALATINAVDIAAGGYNSISPGKPCPVTAFAYASPKVGNAGFLNLFNSQSELRLLRIHNVPDTVPLYPLVGYSDVGQVLLMDSRRSKYLKYPGDFSSRHDLEAAYLHGLAGAHGINGDFHLEVKRDIALVNKYTNFVRDEYLIPPKWWVVKHRGMVQKEDGSWLLEDHEKDDDDPTLTDI